MFHQRLAKFLTVALNPGTCDNSALPKGLLIVPDDLVLRPYPVCRMSPGVLQFPLSLRPGDDTRISKKSSQHRVLVSGGPGVSNW